MKMLRINEQIVSITTFLNEIHNMSYKISKRFDSGSKIYVERFYSRLYYSMVRILNEIYNENTIKNFLSEFSIQIPINNSSQWKMLLSRNLDYKTFIKLDIIPYSIRKSIDSYVKKICSLRGTLYPILNLFGVDINKYKDLLEIMNKDRKLAKVPHFEKAFGFNLDSIYKRLDFLSLVITGDEVQFDDFFRVLSLDPSFLVPVHSGVTKIFVEEVFSITDIYNYVINLGCFLKKFINSFVVSISYMISSFLSPISCFFLDSPNGSFKKRLNDIIELAKRQGLDSTFSELYNQILSFYQYGVNIESLINSTTVLKIRNFLYQFDEPLVFFVNALFDKQLNYSIQVLFNFTQSLADSKSQIQDIVSSFSVVFDNSNFSWGYSSFCSNLVKYHEHESICNFTYLSLFKKNISELLNHESPEFRISVNSNLYIFRCLLMSDYSFVDFFNEFLGIDSTKLVLAIRPVIDELLSLDPRLLKLSLTEYPITTFIIRSLKTFVVESNNISFSIRGMLDSLFPKYITVFSSLSKFLQIFHKDEIIFEQSFFDIPEHITFANELLQYTNLSLKQILHSLSNSSIINQSILHYLDNLYSSYSTKGLTLSDISSYFTPNSTFFRITQHIHTIITAKDYNISHLLRHMTDLNFSPVINFAQYISNYISTSNITSDFLSQLANMSHLHFITEPPEPTIHINTTAPSLLQTATVPFITITIFILFFILSISTRLSMVNSENNRSGFFFVRNR